MAPTDPSLTETLTATPGGTVEFPDNRLLIDLCGPYDGNLAQIEKALNVQIMRRGNQLSVVGPHDVQTDAVRILHALYARLESGRPVEAGDIDRELRMGPFEDAGSEDGDQLEMPIGSRVEIQTRKKRVEPRTEAQKAYVRSLFEHELAFGIGPAGTGKNLSGRRGGCINVSCGSSRQDHSVAPGG